eukprot:CAMPEP_0194291578 /NCGR_PEP_ID=MMETSP0169-20130528/43686_1 /TAXON_ID=218684 /ORGANISM="Corethron pennatum, Strain L29A3" /LENGTH=31 /DNA_ID= /DNA_START= /DNA_END= /DNA_ORIENTATION=
MSDPPPSSKNGDEGYEMEPILLPGTPVGPAD